MIKAQLSIIIVNKPSCSLFKGQKSTLANINMRRTKISTVVQF